MCVLLSFDQRVYSSINKNEPGSSDGIVFTIFYYIHMVGADTRSFVIIRPGAIASSIKLFIICWVFNGSSVSLKSSFHPRLHGRVKAVDLNREIIVFVKINWLC